MIGTGRHRDKSFCNSVQHFGMKSAARCGSHWKGRKPEVKCVWRGKFRPFCPIQKKIYKKEEWKEKPHIQLWKKAIIDWMCSQRLQCLHISSGSKFDVKTHFTCLQWCAVYILSTLLITNCIPKFVVVIISFFLKETIVFHPVITQEFGPANIILINYLYICNTSGLIVFYYWSPSVMVENWIK